MLTASAYVVLFKLPSLLLDHSKGGLGDVVAATYIMLYAAFPMLTAVLMRFSLFKWYVDPIAAAIFPIFLYSGMLVNQVKRTKELSGAFLLLNDKLSDDGGMGWAFLAASFLFGLLASFSFARKNRQSISYRILFGRSTEGENEKTE